MSAFARRAIIGLVPGLLALPWSVGWATTVTGVIGDLGPGPAVAYLEPAGDVPVTPSDRPIVMDQKNLAFVPRVLPVVRGTTIKFINSDDVQHNVFSPSEAGGRFDLGTDGPGTARTVVLNEIGDVRVLCNIHMEMEAHILVLASPTFAPTETDGRYQIEDVPPGLYTLRVWQGRWLPIAREIEVPLNGALAIDVP